MSPVANSTHYPIDHPQWEIIFDEVRQGKPISSCLSPEHIDRMSIKAFYTQLDRNPTLREEYTRARQMKAEIMIDKAQAIADCSDGDIMEDGRVNNANVQRARLRVGHIEWMASKVLREQYGDKQTIEVDVNVQIIDRLKNARERMVDHDASVIEHQPNTPIDQIVTSDEAEVIHNATDNG